jgi:hypothetical protein
MAALTLDRVLTDAETLPVDEQEMLENLLRQRRIEAWRQETAAEAKKTVKAFRDGKLKSQSVEDVIARLRAAK